QLPPGYGLGDLPATDGNEVHQRPHHLPRRADASGQPAHRSGVALPGPDQGAVIVALAPGERGGAASHAGLVVMVGCFGAWPVRGRPARVSSTETILRTRGGPPDDQEGRSPILEGRAMYYVFDCRKTYAGEETGVTFDIHVRSRSPWSTVGPYY